MRTLKLLVALIVVATLAACGSPDNDGSALDTLEPPPTGEVQDTSPPSTSTSGATSSGPVSPSTSSTTVPLDPASTSNPGTGSTTVSTGTTRTTRPDSTTPTETTRTTETTGAAQTSTTRVSTTTQPSRPTAAPSPTTAATTPKKPQTISFAPPAGPWAYDEVKAIAASASSGLSPAYEATGACVVDNAVLGVFRATDVGTCRITASQAGDASWHPATPVTRSITISKATPSIQGFAGQSTPYLRRAFAIPLTATASGGAVVKYRMLVNDNGYEFCTVAGNQLQVPETGGLPETCVVEAYVEESRLFVGQSATARFTITPTVVRFIGQSIGAISDTSVTVSVSLNLVWDIEVVDSSCGATSDSVTGQAQYQLTFVTTPGSRPVPCTITIATAFIDQAHTVETKIITISDPAP